MLSLFVIIVYIVKVVRVCAFAGTGKTSTLINYAKTHHSKRILYIAFNKSVREHANKIFPQNTTCKTWHSLAYSHFLQQHALTPPQMNQSLATSLKYGDVKQFLNISDSYVANLIIKTLGNFLVSSATHIELIHVPEIDGIALVKDAKLPREQIMVLATQMLDHMKNFKKNNISITHDFYFKMYQLAKPIISGYDILMVDEAQDTSDVQLSVLQNQVGHSSILLVGDTHQQIYSFRGAVDAMQKIPVSKTFYLSTSFRFGYEIAAAANNILSLKNEKQLLVGIQPECVVTNLPLQIKDLKDRYTFMARYNVSLFRKAFSLLDSNISICFHGGIDSYNMPLIEDVCHLYMNNRRSIKVCWF